jgi:hypothetical protein
MAKVIPYPPAGNNRLSILVRWPPRRAEGAGLRAEGISLVFTGRQGIDHSGMDIERS